MLELTDYPVIHTQMVAWGDMDAFGHVNNVMYYRYIESARINYMDKIEILNEDVYSVVASNQCQYLKPLFYPDQLKIGVRVEELRNSAFRMHYLLWSETQQCVVAMSEAVVVCVDKMTMQKKLIPENTRENIKSLELSVNHLL